MKRQHVFGVLMVVVGLLVTFNVVAQNTVTLSLNIPGYLEQVFTEAIIADFEAQNSGVDVVVIGSDNGEAFFDSPAYASVEQHFDSVASYVDSADVLFVQTSSMSPMATAAGYFLDLAPLLQTDTAFDAAAYHPAMVESLQWDGGTWGLPLTADIRTLTYNPQAFDAAGIAYPTPTWTINDLANAARAVTQRDSNGNVSAVGFWDLNATSVILRAANGTGFYDPTQQPAPPQMLNPELEQVVSLWAELMRNQVVGLPPGGGGDPMQAPMTVFSAIFPNMPGVPANAALLPNGVTILDATGLAVSGGTAQPELAYQLVVFLANHPDVSANMFGGVPARVDTSPTLPPETDLAAINAALAAALPASELRYADYLAVALDRVVDEGVDVRTALTDAQAAAQAALDAALARRGAAPVTVTQPDVPPPLADGDAELRFAVSTFITELPNSDQWDAVAESFAATTAGIGRVSIETVFSPTVDMLANEYDCFVSFGNLVPNANLSMLRNLDPFIDSDPLFSADDLIGDTLGQVQRDGMTWGYPLMLIPQDMRYNTALFDSLGIPQPDNRWDVTAFAAALETLAANSDGAPFANLSSSSTHLMMLIAGYGGLPIDYRTTPPTINFTDPATVTAIGEVLTLAQNGLIDYQQPLATFGGGGGGGGMLPPIVLNATGPMGYTPAEPPYRPVNFPTGGQYTPITYGLGVAYISAMSAQPEACYQWISRIAQNPALFYGIPARRSLVNDAALASSVGAETSAFFAEYVALLDAPDVLVFPDQFNPGGTGSTFVIEYWLNRVFDRVVLEDATLETELQAAQQLADGFAGCLETSGGDVATCAVTLDPELQPLFRGGGGGGGS